MLLACMGSTDYPCFGVCNATHYCNAVEVPAARQQLAHVPQAPSLTAHSTLLSEVGSVGYAIMSCTTATTLRALKRWHPYAVSPSAMAVMSWHSKCHDSDLARSQRECSM